MIDVFIKVFGGKRERGFLKTVRGCDTFYELAMLLVSERKCWNCSIPFVQDSTKADGFFLRGRSCECFYTHYPNRGHVF